MNRLRLLLPIKRHIRNIHCTTLLTTNDLYEPDYLEAMKSPIPTYDAVNIQITGYDYPVLENFQKFIHSLAKNLEIDVDDCWGLPAQELQVTTLKPKSEIVSAQYNMKIYHRTVQVTDVPTPQLPLLLRAIEASTPAGVNLNVVPHEESHEEIRYIPDTELNQLKEELEIMGGPAKKK